MNEAAPISWLMGEVNSIVTSGANATAQAISVGVAPLAAVGVGIYVILIMINYLRGAETEPVIDFGLRLASFAIVIGLGLNASNYANHVIPIVTELGPGLASAASGGSTPTNTSLDQLLEHYIKIMDEGFESASSMIPGAGITSQISVFIKCLIILVGLLPFLAAATVTLVIAAVGSVIVAMLGPIYFGFLLFPATRQYFNAWLNTAFSYALIPLLVAVVAGLSVSISHKIFADAGGNLHETSMKVVVIASACNLVLLFMLKQVGALASSLSAGGINANIGNGAGMLMSGGRMAGKGAGLYAKGAYRTMTAVGSLMNKSGLGGSIKPNKRKAG